MSRGHVVVVDPAIRVPELSCHNRMAARSALPLTYHLPAMHGTASLKEEAPESIRGVIILGSGSSVHDGFPWQQELADWLMPLAKGGVPTLGLCFGHQLVAHLFGGEVGFVAPDQRKLKGLRRVRVEANGPFPYGEGELVVSHRETVTRIPPGFEVFASSPEIPTDGLAHTSHPIWTFQAHPEATAAFVKNQEMNPLPESAFAFGHRLVDAFLDFVEKRARELR